MSAPVDVLAALDRALMLVNDDDDHDGQPFDTDKSAEVYAGLAQARAAVAELVDLADAARGFMTGFDIGQVNPHHVTALRQALKRPGVVAALARVQGGAA